MRNLLIILLFIPLVANAHGGEDHGAEKRASLPVAAYFSSETVSDKYELLVKYPPIEPGKQAALRLFISNVRTNAPVDVGSLNITIADINKKVTAKRIDKGTYQLDAVFPEKKAYAMNVSITGGLGADLVQLTNIQAGQALPEAHADEEHGHSYWIYLVGGLFGGALLTLVVIMLSRKRINRNTAAIWVLAVLLPTGTMDVKAHGGEDHGDGKKTGAGTLSNAFRVEKETQFLFGFLTEQVGTGAINQSVNIFGTVVPAPLGNAVIQTPQTGRILSLRVTPGQSVSKGQVLATIEQAIDAGTQIDILAQSNTVNAEYQAAKVQYERLKNIQDIAAKKDVSEAKARYEAALQNKRLFETNVGRSTGGSTKVMTLTSPISGVVGTFNYAIGAVVNAGETIFTITNLNNVYVEAQVFSTEVSALRAAMGFTTRSSNAENPMDYTLEMVAQPQEVNTANQSQRVLFRIKNPNGQLKIGENVTVTVRTNVQSSQIALPNDAITEVNGKPAVFIKDKAEQISISFVGTGQQDPNRTVITSGVEDGEKVITQNVYELKMIYLNQ